MTACCVRKGGEHLEKYRIEKNTVQETPVIPLYGRKVCSERFPRLFNDPEAERICSMLDCDFFEKGRRMESTAGLFGAPEAARRQYDIGCEVKEYLNAFFSLEDPGELKTRGCRFASATSRSCMRGYLDIYREVGLIHRLVIRFCDSLVKMVIIKIQFGK